jgi:DNA repair protein RadC
VKRIADLPKLERPREKLLSKGPEALSGLELLAILLSTGTKGHDVMTVAHRILQTVDRRNGKINWEDLQKIEGVDAAKASLIAAASAQKG